MTEEKKIKIGDFLYKISYCFSKREIEKVKVKKINAKSYSLVGGIVWTIKKSEIGDTWNTSLEKAIQRTIGIHEGEITEKKEQLGIWYKELRFLKKKLNKLKIKEAMKK